MPESKTQKTRTDGRRARGHVSRSRIVAAMIELVREGCVAPTAEQVALRADVGLRTVFRHFDDMESLYREMASEVHQLILPVIDMPFIASDLPGRLEEVIERRCQLFEAILPFQRATEALRHQSAFLQEEQIQMQHVQRQMLCRVLPRHVQHDPALLAAVDLLLGIDGWSQLRLKQKLSPQQARESLLRSARLLTA
jgi:AcrR family transcriptional regulator